MGGMPETPEQVIDERSDLLDALDKRRSLLCQTAQGLTDEEAVRRTTKSDLCIGGIIKHVTRMENRWVDFILGGPDTMRISPESMADHVGSFQVQPGESLSILMDRYNETARRTADVVAALPSLDDAQPLPEAPWFPAGARWSARAVLLHIISETAHHSGHADIIRESLDGAKTMG
jgi:uncharacterized damage-inducible protein DinB